MFDKIVSFAESNGFLMEDKKIFKDCLNEMSKYLFDEFSSKELTHAYSKWEKCISDRTNLCFHSSVFEYIIITLMTIIYYKNKVMDNEIEGVEINILTTQSPKSLDKKADSSYNPYFKTEKALVAYTNTFKKLVEESNGKITVNRHFLYKENPKQSDNTKFRYGQSDNRIKLIYPEKTFQYCYCKDLERRNAVCKNGKCYDQTKKDAQCKKLRNYFLSNKYTNHYIFPLLDIVSDTEINNPKNPEIREFIGFKVIKKIGFLGGKKEGVYEKCYTSNLTDSMTSMFIKIWNQKELYESGGASFHFIGMEDAFSEFITKLEQNAKRKENNLITFWGLEDSESEVESASKSNSNTSTSKC